MENKPPTPPSWRNYSRSQWTALIVFSIANMISSLSYSLQGPFFPQEAESKNVTASEYGIVIGSYEVTAFIMCPLLGTYMYAIGPKTGFKVGVLVEGISLILFGFLNRINDRTCFFISSLILRILQGTGASATFVSIYSFVTLEFPNSVAATFAIMETAFGFGICVGPVLGELLYQLGGFTIPFVVIGCIITFSPIVWNFLLIKPVNPSDPDKTECVNSTESRYGGVFHLIRIPAILINIFGTFIGGFTLGFLGTTLEPHIRQFNLSATSTGFTFLSYGAVYAITGPTIIGPICDRTKQPSYVTIAGSSLIFIAFVLIGPAPFIPIRPVLWLTLAGLIIFGVGLGAIYISTFIVTLQEAMRNNYPDSVATYGLVSGLWMSALSLGAFTGPVAAGFLQDNFGFRNATCAVFVLTSILTLFLLISNIKRANRDKKSLDINNDGRSLLNYSNDTIWDDQNVL